MMMLLEQTVGIMRKLRLHGMVEGLEHQQANPSLQSMSFEDRLGLIVDAERLARENRRLTRLLKEARLKVAASPEAIDYRCVDADSGFRQGPIQERLTKLLCGDSAH
jgi:hypothetical protein